MKKVIIDESSIQAGVIEEGAFPSVVVSYKVIDWFEPREWVTDWVEDRAEEDKFPTYHHHYNNDRGIFTGPTLRKSTPYVGTTITEKRGHVKEWSDEDTGQRMAEVEWEYRTRRV